MHYIMRYTYIYILFKFTMSVLLTKNYSREMSDQK